jgi:hypothetical protein
MFSITSMNFISMSDAIALKAFLKLVVPVIRPRSCELKLVVIVWAIRSQLAVSSAKASWSSLIIARLCFACSCSILLLIS